jgi:hypothetical protein
MRQKLYIFKHLAKSKTLFFANIYHSSLDFYYAEKLKALYPTTAKNV